MDAAHLKPARDHCLAPARAVDAPLGAANYGRMFPDLPPLAAEEGLLLALGQSGGVCDGSPFAERGGDDAAGAAGWPHVGQFVAHDITADRSGLTAHADVAALRNARRPRIDLECLYADGPSGAPYLYDRHDPAKLLLGLNDRGAPDDLPRNRQGVALIGDPRNDVHLFVSQLHVAMIKLHNGVVDRLRRQRVAEPALFAEAQRAVRWHYQWIVLHDFLPRLVGAELAQAVLDGDRRWYRPAGEPFIPVEFADAAYRYGHSQIRHSYRTKPDADPVPIFPDLLGFDSVPATRVVDWAALFDLPGRPPAQRARKIDGRLARSLIELPVAITGAVDLAEYHSLAARDLRRGQGTGLPSGEAVARAMAVEPLTAAEIGLAETGWRAETPLWFYILKEAEARQDGDRLGPVGGRIVAEVLVGIVERDDTSQRAVDPAWRPTLPAAEPGSFTLADLFAFVAAADAAIATR